MARRPRERHAALCSATAMVLTLAASFLAARADGSPTKPASRPPPPVARQTGAGHATAAHVVDHLPPVPNHSLYFRATMWVRSPPHGHVSAQLDAALRGVSMAIFGAMGAAPSGPFHLVHVQKHPPERVGAPPPFELRYYFAMPKGSAQHVTHFAAFCGWLDHTGGATGHDHVHEPGDADGGAKRDLSHMTDAMRVLPAMGNVTVTMPLFITSEGKIGPEGADILHGTAVVGPHKAGSANGGDGKGKGGTGPPWMIIGLSAAGAGVVVLALVAFVVRRRQAAATLPELPVSGPEPSTGDRGDEEWGADGDRKRGDRMSWPGGRWSRPSFTFGAPRILGGRVTPPSKVAPRQMEPNNWGKQ